MAFQEYPVQTAAPLKGGGIEDDAEVVQSPNFYRMNAITQRDKTHIRMAGKRLTLTLTEPIMAIHFDRKGGCFIQTSAHLYRYLETDITGGSSAAGGGFL